MRRLGKPADVPSIYTSYAIFSRPKPPVVYIRDAVPLLSEYWLHGPGQEASLAWVPVHLCAVKDEFLPGCNRISILSRFVLAAGH